MTIGLFRLCLFVNSFREIFGLIVENDMDANMMLHVGLSELVRQRIRLSPVLTEAYRLIFS